MHNYFNNATEGGVDALLSAEPVLIIAPHQDDESLGCGGTIALARKAGIDVHVIFVTDGSQSHPNSKKYPHGELVGLREQEAIDALSLLGVSNTQIHFMRLPDGNLPFFRQPGFNEGAGQMLGLLSAIKPGVILLPWRRDPHRDHRATWEITAAAITQAGKPPLTFEYFIWLFERAGGDDMPGQQEGKLFYVDISAVLPVKKKAILAHLSQTTALIDDDADGFRLSEDMLHHFDFPKEYFIQTTLKLMGQENRQTLSENYFDEVYRENEDPWDLATSTYERDKYQATVDALPNGEYGAALEIGCSIGVLTEALLQKCNKILAIDVADAPVKQATERLEKYPQATVKKMAVPATFPEEQFDLVVMSEVGYFFSIPDLHLLQQRITKHLNDKGQLLLVHWTPFVPDFPLTGDQVHDFFMEQSGAEKPFKHVFHRRADKYRLDLFEKQQHAGF